jgi:transcriptional regulator with XRE-family HTH domain
MNEFNTTILGERARRRVRQSALAEAEGIHKATLVDIERGRIGIDKATFRRLMRRLEALADEDPTA